jgi:hypothetical protein
MFFHGFTYELVKLGSMYAKAGRKSPAARRVLWAAAKRLPSTSRVTPEDLAHHARMKAELSYATKTGSIKEVARRLAEIARQDPAALKGIAKELAAGPGGSVAKGVIYGAGGYGALKGLCSRHPQSRRREPLEGAGRGALKGVALGLPAALLLRYPALKRALGVG